MLDIIVCLIFAGLLRWIYARRASLLLPPGPPSLPIIGNLHYVPPSQPWLKLIEWGRQYGNAHTIVLVPSEALTRGICDQVRISFGSIFLVIMLLW